MVAGDLLVRVPPDTLDRVQVRGVLGQKVNHDPIAVLGQVLMNRPAVMQDRVVADNVNLPIASQPCAKVVQVPDEQDRVAPLAESSETTRCTEGFCSFAKSISAPIANRDNSPRNTQRSQRGDE